MAEAVLKPLQGKSFLHSSEPVSSENISQFKISNETVEKAKELFRQFEIEVVQAGMTLTLMGLPEKFEALLDVKMVASKDDSQGTQHLIPNKDPVIPEALQPFVDTIVFPKPILIKP
ncbi:sulfite reductase [Paenibacillus popilliae ATCC 14706]|uniref:Sulfite reductase n=2 Tax=Paenibacillus popilliae TaxID=78057 RepID=M9L9Y7_PAEPP|nr:sulfite reductase [Paenibacillus popilliae ATCC 14706]